MVFESAFGGREVSISLERSQSGSAKRIEYQLLATSKTSTMEKALKQAGACQVLRPTWEQAAATTPCRKPVLPARARQIATAGEGRKQIASTTPYWCACIRRPSRTVSTTGTRVRRSRFPQAIGQTPFRSATSARTTTRRANMEMFPPT